ncbi:uncharacterized protein [Anabrus simplex]|uniref:uncharacterized protein isoform X2 n=1 Tax=Anabrus simplex TaxID=316456 RepID=UPI0035A38266
MAQFYQLVHGGGSTTVTLDEIHHMYPNGHIQYIINDDETGAIQYQNQPMIGIDQQTGATVQLGSYPHQQQIVVENSPHQPGVYVIETIDPSAQAAIEVQQPAAPQPQQPQQQEILTAQPQPTQFVAQQQTDPPQEVFYNRQPANNGLVVEAGVHLPTSVSPQQVATGSPLHSRHLSGATPAYQRVKQPQAQVQQQQQQQIPQVAQVAQVVQHVQQAAQQQLLTHQQSIIQLADGRKVSLVQWRRMQEQQHQLASAAAKGAERGITVVPSPARPQQPAVRQTNPRQTTPRQPARQRQTARPRQNNRQNNRQNKTTVTNETVLTTLMQQRQQQQHEQPQQQIQQQEPLRQQQPQQAPQILQQQVPVAQQQVHQQQIQRPQQQIPRQQQISQPQQQQSLPLVQQQQQLPPQPQPQAHQQQIQPPQQQMQPSQQQMQPPQQQMQSPQQLQQVQQQQPHALSPAVQRPMQVRQEYAGPKRLYAPTKARMRSHNTLIANNTVQAIASPTTGGNHQSLLQQHDSSNVISVSDQLNSALAPAVVEEQPTQVKLEEPVNTTQVLFLLPNGQQRFIKFDVPPHAQDFCLKDLLSQVGLKEGESNVTIMSCGGLPPEQPVVLQAEEEVQVKQEPVEQPQTPCNGTVLVSGNVLTASVAVSTTPQEQQVVKNEDTLELKQEIKEKFYPKVPIKLEALTEGSKGTKRCAAGKKKRKLVEEPVILTLSSDEDDNGRQSDLESSALSERSYSGNDNSFVASDPAVTSSAMGKEPKIPEEEDGSDTSENRHLQGVKGGGRELDLEAIIDGTMQGQYTLLQCRTVRIGSYKVVPRERVILSNIGVKLSVPSIEDDDKNVTLTIDIEDIVKVLIHFGRGMPVVFLYTSAPAAAKIRNLLKMESKLGPYFDPSSGDDTQRRITLLPEKLLEESKVTLKTIFGNLNILAELNNKEANDILVRASPKEVQNMMKKAVGMSPAKNSNEIQTIMVYPPPPAKGGIPINTEDYACLGEDQFLNDVIIDFYLKYLTLSVLSERDQARTHVFSSFFYKRLTTRPAKSTRRSHPVEDDPKLSPAEKRHSRVKGWTKNVNLFEKDFIIIPINEHCHWFLAIICFPGMIGCVRMSDNAPVVEPAKKTKMSPKKVIEADVLGKPIVIGSTTITPLKISTDTITLEAGEEGSDRDEAEGDDEDMDGTSEEEDNSVQTSQPTSPFELFTELPQDQSSKCEPKVKNVKSREPIRQPCILIFDSLAGASRTRVVATLRDYLRIEYKVKEGKERDFSKDTIKGASPKVPQQTNFTDCGLYLLQYVESFFKDPIKDYHLPMKILANWFSEDVVNHKREEIQKLLLDLMEKNNVDVENLNLPKLTFSNSQPEVSSADSSGCANEELSQHETVEGGLVFTCTEEEEEEEYSGAVDGESVLPSTNNGVKNVSTDVLSPQVNCERRTLVNYSDSESNGENASMDTEPSITLPVTDNKKCTTMSYLKSKRIDRHIVKEQDKPIKKMRADESRSNFR